jgi:TetR/AcrR family transcriptional regulator, fatty acid metabolism regulator protein
VNARSGRVAAQSVSDRGRERGARRRRILEAAEAVFSAREYHSASVTEIATRAELATGTIYLYFSDKADLYGNVILGKMSEVVDQVRKALISDPSASVCLRAAVHALFAYHDSNRPFFELFLHQHQTAASPLNESHWKEMEDLKRRNLGFIEDCIVRGQASRELRPGNPRLYAVAFLGVTLQMIRQWIRERGAGRLADSADFAADCFLNGAATPRSSEWSPA